MREKYRTPNDLRVALEARLLAESKRLGRDLAWMRRRVALVQLMVRLAAYDPDSWIVKGGMAVELPEPPVTWAEPYRELAEEVGHDVLSHVDAHRLVAEHWRELRSGSA